MSQLQEYVQKRRNELKAQVHPDFMQVLDSGFDLIEWRLSNYYQDTFGPRVARQVELLEVLLFSFMNHCGNPALLDEMDKHLTEIRIEKDKTGGGGMFH